MNVLTYVRLRRLARDRLKLGVRPALVESHEPASTQQQQIVGIHARLPNGSRVDGIYTTADIARNEINSHSGCIELHAKR